MDFDVPAEDRIKLKESEKKDKYLDLARELNPPQKKLRNIKVTIIPIVIGAFSTVTKGLLKGVEDLEVGGRVETIQTTLFRTARILRRVLETWGDLLSLKLDGPSAETEVKNSQGVNYHHHHYVTLSARISLTLSRHPSLSSIAFGRSSRLHPVSAQSCCM